MSVSLVRPNLSPDVYFRGVCDSSYELLSTLERSGLVGMFSLEYYRAILEMKPDIERVSGCTWNVPSSNDYQSSYSRGSPFMLRRRCYSQAVFDYMAWLRHYGFMSPLLDWTRSLDVANVLCLSSNGFGRRLQRQRQDCHLCDGLRSFPQVRGIRSTIRVRCRQGGPQQLQVFDSTCCLFCKCRWIQGKPIMSFGDIAVTRAFARLRPTGCSCQVLLSGIGTRCRSFAPGSWWRQ